MKKEMNDPPNKMNNDEHLSPESAAYFASTSEFIDSFVNLIPFRYYKKDAEVEEVEVFASDKSGRAKRGDSAPHQAGRLDRHILNKSRCYAPSEWRSSAQRLANLYDIEKTKAHQKHGMNSTAAREKTVKKNTGAQSSKSGIPLKGESDGSTVKLSHAELNQKLLAKIEALRNSGIRSQKKKNKWIEKRRELERLPKEIPLENETKAKEVQESADTDFNTLVFNTAAQDAAAGKLSQNKKGSKSRKLQASVRALKSEEKRITAAEVGEKEATMKAISMAKAIKKARGEKIAENLQSLRKAQKVLKRKKLKSKRRWAERQEQGTKKKTTR